MGGGENSSSGNYGKGNRDYGDHRSYGKSGASGLDRTEVRRRMDAVERSKYQGYMRVMQTSERAELIQMCCEAGDCKDIMKREQSMKDISRILEIMGPCARMAWDGFDFAAWTHYRQTMDFCAWISGEMKEDKWDEFFVYIRKNLYRWGGPRLIRDAGGLVNFLLDDNGMKQLLLDEMGGAYGNVSFCGGSSIMNELEIERRKHEEKSNKDDGVESSVGHEKTLGDVFSDIGKSLSDNIHGQDGKEKGNGSNVSESGTGGGGGSGSNPFDCVDGREMMETPVEQTKVTREMLMSKMKQLQEDFDNLEQSELNDSPAAAVKKRKRRKSSGQKGNG